MNYYLFVGLLGLGISSSITNSNSNQIFQPYAKNSTKPPGKVGKKQGRSKFRKYVKGCLPPIQPIQEAEMNVIII